MNIKIPKKLLFIILFFIFLIVGIAVFGKPKSQEKKEAQVVDTIATITVKAGYTPQVVTLPANEVSVIRFITKNTYDCSAALLIPKLQIEQFLPPTGSTDIQIPAQVAGTEIIAGCSMGMYSFKIKFL